MLKGIDQGLKGHWSPQFTQNPTDQLATNHLHTFIL